MKLHQIKFEHVAPKDREAGIKTWVIADSEDVIRVLIDQKYGYDIWSSSADETFTIYDDDYNAIGTETHTERLMRLRGQIGDEEVSYEDAYYGVTVLGWDEGVEITEADAVVLIRLGVAEDWRATS